jgi:sugar lactone lactonase YvrE
MAFGKVIRSFAAPQNTPRGICFLGHDVLLGGSAGGGILYQLGWQSGVTKRAAASPATAPVALEFTGSQVVLCDQNTATIMTLSWPSLTLIRSVAAPAAFPSGVAFTGSHLLTCDLTTNRIYIHSWPSLTVTHSVVLSFGDPAGMIFTGSHVICVDYNGGQTGAFYQLSYPNFTVIRSAATPSTSAWGLGRDGRTMIHTDFATDRIYQIALS